MEFIGMHIKRILLERYFHNNTKIGIIRIFLHDGIAYHGITCAEGNVSVHKTENPPENIYEDVYNYRIEPFEADWIGDCRISSVSYICSHGNENGIAVFLDNGHNIVFYNTGYEDGDEDIFETDVDISKFNKSYKLITP